MGKKKNKEAETIPVSKIMEHALKVSKKPGEYETKFTALGTKRMFTVKSSEVKKADGSIMIRRAYSINTNKISLPAVKLVLDSVARANGENPEGRRLARTTPTILAILDWQEKTGIVLTKEFKKTETKTKFETETETETEKGGKSKPMISKKPMKKALKRAGVAKDASKMILEVFGEEKEIKAKKFKKALKKQGIFTSEEIESIMTS